MLRFALLFFALLGLSSTSSAKDWSGEWVVRSGGVPLFSFEVKPAGDSYQASWSRPAHFSMTPAGLEDIEGVVIRVSASKVEETGEGLALTFPRPGSNESVRFMLTSPNDRIASLRLPDIPPEVSFEPFDISRENAKPNFVAWLKSARYPFNRTYPDNPEMKAMFEADQAARMADRIDWANVGPEDATRRKRTRELLDANALNSGADFYYASFIFQHGEDQDDYLLAHVLATAAMARGYDASWIAAATLDRYLQKIGKSQVFGTQFSKAGDGAWTQAPYAAELIPDSLRKVVGVPGRKSQDDRLNSMK